MRTVRWLPAILAALSLSTTATPVAAQTRPAAPPSRAATAEGIGIGALGGITRTSFKFDGVSDLVDDGTGLMFGIWFGGNRNGRVGFMGEASFVTKSGHEVGGPGKLKLTYLEIPAAFRINLGGLQEGTRFYALVGPVVDIKIKASEDGEDVGDFYAGFDVGLLGGAGVEVNRIGVEMRGIWGVRNFALPSEATDEVKTFTLQVVGKVRFN